MNSVSKPNLQTTNGNDQPAIESHDLSKCYRIYKHPRDRLRQSLWPRNRLGQPIHLYQEFWALRPISFALQRGRTLGVMGRNGSGKSTLLQLLCGTLTPTSGEVKCNGRIGALLELGSGFNPDFSGLENIYLNAALLGLKRNDVDQRLDDILGFADIGDFVQQPVKMYSSGMAVRLAFAVQAHIDPDVLVVDEALAVGDELFQKKCYRHLEKLKDNGTAILLVTHSCPQILQHCDEALLLHKGKARLSGKPASVTVTYQRLINASDAEWDSALSAKASSSAIDSKTQSTQTELPRSETASSPIEQKGSHQSSNINGHGWLDPNLIPKTTERYESRGATITDVWIENSLGERCNTLPFGEAFQIIFTYTASKQLKNIGFACHIANHTGLRITGQTHPSHLGHHQEGSITKIEADQSCSITYHFHGGLWPGVYVIGGGILFCNSGGNEFVDRVIDFRALRILEQPAATVVGTAMLQSKPPTYHLI